MSAYVWGTSTRGALGTAAGTSILRLAVKGVLRT